MKNVGTKDAQARWVLGFSLFLFSFFLEGGPHWILLGLGAVFVATAYFRFCPIWFGVRVNTHSPVRKN